MKHTSINISEDHLDEISEAGMRPTAVIREAINIYWAPKTPCVEV